MYLCDSCGAFLVVSGKIPPLTKIYGANNIPFKECDCEICRSNENCMKYPGHLMPNDIKIKCPECLTKVTKEELDSFGGLCEECSGAFDDE